MFGFIGSTSPSGREAARFRWDADCGNYPLVQSLQVRRGRVLDSMLSVSARQRLAAFSLHVVFSSVAASEVQVTIEGLRGELLDNALASLTLAQQGQRQL